MNNKILVLIILLFCKNTNSSKILNISIPKAGTFLLMRALELITNRKCHIGIVPQIYEPSIDILEKSIQHSGFSCLHLIFNPEYENFLNNKGCKACFIFRDPRDQLVSAVYFMLNNSEKHGRFEFDSLLSALIGKNDKIPQGAVSHFIGEDLLMLSPQEYISNLSTRHFYKIS